MPDVKAQDQENMNKHATPIPDLKEKKSNHEEDEKDSKRTSKDTNPDTREFVKTDKNKPEEKLRNVGG